MGRMRKEIMGKFLQSSWDSIRDNTSLKDGLVALRENKERRNIKILPLQVKKQVKIHYETLWLTSHIIG